MSHSNSQHQWDHWCHRCYVFCFVFVVVVVLFFFTIEIHADGNFSSDYSFNKRHTHTAEHNNNNNDDNDNNNDADDDDDDDNNNNEPISRAPFHGKHAELRWTGANTNIQNTCHKCMHLRVHECKLKCLSVCYYGKSRGQKMIMVKVDWDPKQRRGGT